jgi:hypothetical protein
MLYRINLLDGCLRSICNLLFAPIPMAAAGIVISMVVTIFRFLYYISVIVIFTASITQYCSACRLLNNTLILSLSLSLGLGLTDLSS